jgi:SAM-dependent methyltransferase
MREYDAWHERHPTGGGPWYRMVWAALERRALLSGARVLEIGCGAGGFAARMAGDGARLVVGQDLSPGAVKRAKACFQRDNLIFEVGDIQEIPYPAGHFDVVVSCETIEHVPDPQRAVFELARVLRPRGTLLLTAPNYMSITGLYRLYRDATGRPWDESGQPLVHWTLLPRTLWWLRRSGLVAERLDGDGWFIPVPRRPRPYAWHPPRTIRAVVMPFALHQLVEARRPSERRTTTTATRQSPIPHPLGRHH